MSAHTQEDPKCRSQLHTLPRSRRASRSISTGHGTHQDTGELLQSHPALSCSWNAGPSTFPRGSAASMPARRETRTPLPPFSSQFFPFRLVQLKITWKAHPSFVDSLCTGFPSPTARGRRNRQRSSSSGEVGVSLLSFPHTLGFYSWDFPKRSGKWQWVALELC